MTPRERIGNLLLLRKQFMERVYPKGTKVLHRFKDCGIGNVLWVNAEFIAVHFENGDEYAYYPEDIKRLDYPIRSNESTYSSSKTKWRN